MAIPLIAAGVVGAAAVGKSIYDTISGKKRRRSAGRGIDQVLANLPQYSQARYTGTTLEESPEMREMLDFARSRYESTPTGMPGQDITEQKLRLQQSGVMGQIQRTADSPTAALNAMQQVWGQTQGAILDIDARAAEYAAQQEALRAQQYQGAQVQMANYDMARQQFNAGESYRAYQSNVSAQQQEYEQNTLMPAQIKLNKYGVQMQQGYAQQQAGIQGLWNAPGQILGAYTAAGGTFGAPTTQSTIVEGGLQ